MDKDTQWERERNVSMLGDDREDEKERTLFAQRRLALLDPSDHHITNTCTIYKHLSLGEYNIRLTGTWRSVERWAKHMIAMRTKFFAPELSIRLMTALARRPSVMRGRVPCEPPVCADRIGDVCECDEGQVIGREGRGVVGEEVDGYAQGNDKRIHR